MKRGFEHRLLPPYKVTVSEEPRNEIPLHDSPRSDEVSEELLDKKYRKVDSRSFSPLPETRVLNADDSWEHS